MSENKDAFFRGLFVASSGSVVIVLTCETEGHGFESVSQLQLRTINHTQESCKSIFVLNQRSLLSSRSLTARTRTRNILSRDGSFGLLLGSRPHMRRTNKFARWLRSNYSGFQPQEGFWNLYKYRKIWHMCGISTKREPGAPISQYMSVP